MKHLDQATILAARDGEAVGDEARAHLNRCAACAAALDRAGERARGIETALTALDRPVEATAAKAGVRARLRGAVSAAAPKGWRGWHLGRAAALLLLTAGAASALPGSPLRSLWIPGPAPTASPVDEPTTPAAAVETTVTATPGTTDVGIAVGIPEGFVHVVVRGALPGAELDVTWTDRASARVTAPGGSRFTYSAGRVEVDASRGSIEIELPVVADTVSLEVDGIVYLTGSPASPQVAGPIVERTDDLIRFRVEER